MTMNGTWGYYAADNAWKTTKALLTLLIQCGSEVEFLTTKGPAGRPVEIYMDGVLKATPNLAAAVSMTKQSAFKASGLSGGTHVLKGVKMGGAILTVDAIRVGNGIGTSLISSTPLILF